MTHLLVHSIKNGNVEKTYNKYFLDDKTFNKAIQKIYGEDCLVKAYHNVQAVQTFKLGTGNIHVPITSTVKDLRENISHALNDVNINKVHILNQYNELLKDNELLYTVGTFKFVALLGALKYNSESISLNYLVS